jgi:hypothetical protein
MKPAKRSALVKGRGGSLILPWPNTAANIRKTARDLRAKGRIAKIEKTDHETYVWTDAVMSSRRN